MSNDDNFEPYWLDEDDWLVVMCPLPKADDNPEVNLEILNWIGRLFGFATATNTRIKVWELNTGEVLATFTCDGPAYCCAFAGDGKRIVASDADGHVHFLRLEEPKPKS